MKSMILAVVSTLSIGTAFSASFTNGDFETGPTGAFVLSSGDTTSIPGWTTGGTASTSEHNGPNDNGQFAQAGSKFLSFGHLGTTGGTLFQTFDTTVGTLYTVNYYVSDIQGGTSSQSMTFEAFNGALPLGSVATAIPIINNAWTAGTTLTFTATSTSTKLIVTDTTTGGGDNNWALDTVTVVPEPTSVALLASGVFAIACFGRRRALNS